MAHVSFGGNSSSWSISCARDWPWISRLAEKCSCPVAAKEPDESCSLPTLDKPQADKAIGEEGAARTEPAREVLADALEEAGCSESEILRHCREPGEHVRGCWVVDLVRGKT
jgi:hypothetical protein